MLNIRYTLSAFVLFVIHCTSHATHLLSICRLFYLLTIDFIHFGEFQIMSLFHTIAIVEFHYSIFILAISRKILRYRYLHGFILIFSEVKTLISSTTRRYLSPQMVKKITGWMDLKDRSYILLKRPNFVLIFLLFPHTSGKYCYIAIDTIQV